LRRKNPKHRGERARDDSILIKLAPKPRPGWAAAFREMAERGDDALLDPGASLSQEVPSALGTSWDKDEWEWR
jgi:hypothetical protein